MTSYVSSPTQPDIIVPVAGSVLYALIEYAADPPAASRWNELRLRRQWPDEASFKSDGAERHNLVVGLVANLIGKLRSGELAATGIWNGGRAREIVPADWWSGEDWLELGFRRAGQPRCRLDLSGSAHSLGSSVHHLRIMEAVATEPPQPPPATDRTGAPGAPSSMHIIIEELHRRAGGDEMIRASIKAESEALASWFKDRHPTLRLPTAKTIRNQIGGLHRSLSQSQN